MIELWAVQMWLVMIAAMCIIFIVILKEDGIIYFDDLPIKHTFFIWLLILIWPLGLPWVIMSLLSSRK